MEKPVPLQFVLAVALALAMARSAVGQSTPAVKIQCHHEDMVNTAEKITEVFKQVNLTMHVCDAPLNNSFCHLVYNLRGRESLTLGCGSCDSIKFDKANQLCEKCNTTNCKFQKSNATFPPVFKLALGRMGECYAFEGNEPTDWKAMNPVKIKCTGTTLDARCSRAFYVENGVKKLVNGCDWDYKAAIKGKITLGRFNKTLNPRCGFCRLRGQGQDPVLPKPECLEPEPELIYGGGYHGKTNGTRLGDSPGGNSGVSGAPAVTSLITGTALLIALRLLTE